MNIKEYQLIKEEEKE